MVMFGSKQDVDAIELLCLGFGGCCGVCWFFFVFLKSSIRTVLSVRSVSKTVLCGFFSLIETFCSIVLVAFDLSQDPMIEENGHERGIRINPMPCDESVESMAFEQDHCFL